MMFMKMEEEKEKCQVSKSANEIRDWTGSFIQVLNFLLRLTVRDVSVLKTSQSRSTLCYTSTWWKKRKNEKPKRRGKKRQRKLSARALVPLVQNFLSFAPTYQLFLHFTFFACISPTRDTSDTPEEPSLLLNGTLTSWAPWGAVVSTCCPSQSFYSARLFVDVLVFVVPTCFTNVLFLRARVRRKFCTKLFTLASPKRFETHWNMSKQLLLPEFVSLQTGKPSMYDFLV